VIISFVINCSFHFKYKINKKGKLVLRDYHYSMACLIVIFAANLDSLEIEERENQVVPCIDIPLFDSATKTVIACTSITQKEI
jgi:hypothetical protein